MRALFYLFVLMSAFLYGCKASQQAPVVNLDRAVSWNEIKASMKNGRFGFISTAHYSNKLPSNNQVLLKAQNHKLVNLKPGLVYDKAGGSLYLADTLVSSNILSDIAVAQAFQNIKNKEENLCIMSDSPEMGEKDSENYPWEKCDYIVKLKDLTVHFLGYGDVRVASNSTRAEYWLGSSRTAADNLPKTYSGDIRVTYIAKWEIFESEGREKLTEVNLMQEMKDPFYSTLDVSDLLEKSAARAGVDFIDFLNSKIR